MSEERTARDPFVGLNRLIERRAEETQRSWYAIGKVLSVSPLKIRADAWISTGRIFACRNPFSRILRQRRKAEASKPSYRKRSLRGTAR